MLRWTHAGGDARRRIAARRGPAPAPVPRRRPSGRHQGRVRRHRLHAAPTSPACATSASACRRRWSSRCAGSCAAGEPFVYAYYDGIDKVAHEYGLGEHYDAELAAADRLVADVLAVLPPGAALVVTADHGQVDVPATSSRSAPRSCRCTRLQSGEGRFRWLHARAGRDASPAGRRHRRPRRPGLGRAAGAGRRRGLVRARG